MESSGLANKLEDMADALSRGAREQASVRVEDFHRASFLSLARAGLYRFGAPAAQIDKLSELIGEVVPRYLRALVEGSLYELALDFLSELDELFERGLEGGFTILEADLNSIVSFLEGKVRGMSGLSAVVVLDCGSIPEVVALAGKFKCAGKNIAIYDRVFVNPVGVTKFLTEQLRPLDSARRPTLRDYASLLRERLGARHSETMPLIDLTVHERGVDARNFILSLNLSRVFERVKQLARQGPVLITSDHGYDLVADVHGLYVTHGYRGKCPLNFSKIAAFLVIY